MTLQWENLETYIISIFWDFPGGPVVKTVYSQCRGTGFYPWSGNKIPHATTKTWHISVQPLSHVRLFATPRTAARQASLSITNSQSLLKIMSIESVRQSNHLSVIPFSSCLQSFPASGSFPMSQFFASGGQSIRVSASASVLPMNIQDWFPLGWTG